VSRLIVSRSALIFRNLTIVGDLLGTAKDLKGVRSVRSARRQSDEISVSRIVREGRHRGAFSVLPSRRR
jgi:hypothetical protein